MKGTDCVVLGSPGAACTEIPPKAQALSMFSIASLIVVVSLRYKYKWGGTLHLKYSNCSSAFLPKSWPILLNLYTKSSNLSWAGSQFKLFQAIICCSLVLPMGLCSVMNDYTIFSYASLVLSSSFGVAYCISNQSLGLPLSDALNLLTTSLTTVL